MEDHQNAEPIINNSNSSHAQGPASKDESARGNAGRANKQPKIPRKKDNPNLRLAELGMKGTGFVKTVKDAGFGFINTPELDEHLFFHASEFVRPEGDEEKQFVDCIAPGDEVEFIVGQNTGARMNLVAQQVRKLPPNTVKAQILSEDCYQGRVVKELNSGSWRSEGSSVGQISFQCKGEGSSIEERLIEFHTEDVYKLRQVLKKGTPVQFYVCTDNQTRAQRAVHLELTGALASANPAEKMLHGFIRELSKTGGVIRCIELDKRFAFKTADVAYESQSSFMKGQAVMFTVMVDPKGAERVSSLIPLPEGSLSAEKSLGKVQGRVVRALPSDRSKETGLIVTPQYPAARAIFNAESGEPNFDIRSLEEDDEVEFALEENLRVDLMVAKQIRLLCRSKQKRELGQVRTKKSNFGFVVCCQRSGQLFFHSTALEDCKFEDLKKGDDVEFSVERHPERGTMAVRLRRVPQGSAVFETVSESKYRGLVLTPAQIISQGVTSSGVLEFEENGGPTKLLFSAGDFKEDLRTGDYATFQIADNLKAAKQVESLGSTVSRMIGRRAVKGELVRYSGIVRQALQGFGYIKYREPGSDTDKRITFSAIDVVNQLDLRSGDEVSFVLTKDLKALEDLARRVTRTREAPASTPESMPNPSPKPLNLAPPVVRTPAMPDGTRGFHMGRGGKLASPTPQPTSVMPPPPGMNGAQARVPGKLLTNDPQARLAAMSNTTANGQDSSTPPGIQHSNGQPSERQNRKKPRPQKPQPNPSSQPAKPAPIAILKAKVQRTPSGHVLNPNAVEFQPQVSGLSSPHTQ